MKEEAARQHYEERATWLNRGRLALLSTLLARHAPKGAREVLDIGAGHGSNVEVLSAYGTVDANELSPVSAARLESRDDVRDVYTDPIPEVRIDRVYDIVCATEVLEHIRDDAAATAWVAEHLRPGGILVATVPAYMWMFSDHDRANLHFRRYTRAGLRRILPGTLEVVAGGYFNTLLFPAAVASRIAWQWRRRIRGSAGEATAKQPSTLPGPLDAAFLMVLRAEARLVGAGLVLPFGLTAYCVARRRD